MQFLLGDLKYEDNFCRHFWSRPGSGTDEASPGWQKGICSTPQSDLSSWLRCLFVPCSRPSVSSSKEGIAVWAACWKQEAKEKGSLRDFESEPGLENMLTLTQLNDLWAVLKIHSISNPLSNIELSQSISDHINNFFSGLILTHRTCLFKVSCVKATEGSQ